MDLSPRMNITTDATVQSQDSQEPAFRRLRRSVEDGHIATLREAQGRGGPLDPMPSAMPSTLNAKSRWRRQVDDAGAVWTHLTEGDLQRLEDREQTLSEILRERYDISAEEADRQVMNFIEDHLSSAL